MSSPRRGGQRGRTSQKSQTQPQKKQAHQRQAEKPEPATPPEQARYAETHVRETTKTYSLDTGQTLARRIYGMLHRNVLEGPMEDVELLVDFWLRAIDEMRTELRKRLLGSAKKRFPKAKISRLPRGVSGGAKPIDDGDYRWSLVSDPERMEEVRDIIFYLYINETPPDEVFGIASKNDFAHAAGERLVSYFEQKYGGPWEPPRRFFAQLERRQQSGSST